MHATCVQSQSYTFIKQITNNNKQNYCASIKEGCDAKYYSEIVSEFPYPDTAVGHIFKIDGQGNMIDSIDISTLMGKKTFYSTYNIENYGDNFLLITMIQDSMHKYLYARVFDTAFNTINESIIDTLQDNEDILNHIVARNDHHVFLTGTYSNYWWNLYVYETDSNFQIIKHINTGFSDGGYPTCQINNVGMVEMTVDSSYIITSYNWRLKTDNAFLHFDTLSNNIFGMMVSTFDNTIKLNDSTYFDNLHLEVNPPFNDTIFTYLNIYNQNGFKIDSIAITSPYEDNRVTQYHDFLSFQTPDTLYYCFAADYGISNYPCIVKMSSNGDIYWVRYVHLNYAAPFGSITATKDGGCILQWMADDQIYLIKADKYGNMPVGINENNNDKQIVIFPNPATDVLNIETSLYKNLQLEIYNVVGQLQTETSLQQGLNRIDISKYARGIYFYRIINKGHFLESGKFIKE
jgi:hypothetical protein